MREWIWPSTLLALIYVFLALGCAHRGSVNTPSSQWIANGSAVVSELEQLNERLTDAYRREDVAQLRRMLSAVHVHNNVFGSRLDRETFLADIESGWLEFLSYETPKIEWFVGNDLAIATGEIEAEAQREGRTVPARRFLFTRVYAREGEMAEWKVLLFHNTMMGPAPKR